MSGVKIDTIKYSERFSASECITSVLGFVMRWLNYYVLDIPALNVVFVASFAISVAPFLYFDLYNKPKWIMKYKTQPGANLPVKRSDVSRIQRCLLWNHVLVGFPYSILFYILQVLRGCDMSFRLPSVTSLLFCLVVSLFLQEIMFYYSHRILHSNYLYKTIHKKHHEFSAPMGIAAFYAHPVEYAFSNIIPAGIGPLLLGSCQVTMFIWVFLGITVTVIHHSGYHLPLLPSPEFHDYHHLKFIGNYGIMGLLDWFHGTYSPSFLESRRGKRDHLILSAAQMH